MRLLTEKHSPIYIIGAPEKKLRPKARRILCTRDTSARDLLHVVPDELQVCTSRAPQPLSFVAIAPRSPASPDYNADLVQLGSSMARIPAETSTLGPHAEERQLHRRCGRRPSFTICRPLEKKRGGWRRG